MLVRRTFFAAVRALRTSVVAALAASSGLSQVTWTQQAPIPTGADLRAVAHLSPAEIWVAGGHGVVAHSSDAGHSWAVSQLATSSLWALFFLDAQRGWAAGNGIFHTSDGGANWVKDSNSGSIYDLYFLDAQRGWACGNGGNSFRTINGGLSWTHTNVGTIVTLSSIWFVDATLGWTIDIDGRIYRSTDGGLSWTLQFNAGGYLSTLQFFNAQEGWAIGGNTFLRTTNGGTSWSPASVPVGTWSHAARFADPLHGISVGHYGNVTRTIDGGQSWTTIAEIGTGPLLWDVESSTSTRSVYVGETGALASTIDSGATWTSIQSGAADETHALDAVDALHAWAANDGGEVARTVDGGHHWQRVLVTGFDNYGYIQDVDFLDASLGWAVGRHEFFGPGIGRIVRSTDGGANWTVQHSIAGAYMEAVEVLDAQTVLAVGQVPSGSRFILRTIDAGQTWANVSPSQAIFMDTDFIDASTGWVVGGQIYKTTNGGQSWTQQYTPSEVLYSVSFSDALHGWAVGWGPTILRTTNGGQTWTPQSTGASTSLYFSVSAVGPDAAWICGSDFVARTLDGGQSWQPEVIPGGDAAVFEALHFLDADTGWLAGPGIWRRGAPCVSPSTYCVAKANSAGGFAAIGWQGTPSAASGGFEISVSNALPQKQGLFFFGSSGPASIPFQAGTLCSQPPHARLPVFTLDGNGAGMQAIQILPAMVGAARHYQFWHRDPGHPDGTNVALSDALQVLFCD